MTVLQAKGVLQRKGCHHFWIVRSRVRNNLKPEPPVNTAIRQELKWQLNWHRRYETPRMTALLRRQGCQDNHERIERLWRLGGLSLRWKPDCRKQRSLARPRRLEATLPNEVWCFDFVHDRTELGKQLKLLTVLDEKTLKCLEIRVENHVDSRTVPELLDELMTEQGTPRYTRIDNGPELGGRGAATVALREGD